MQRFEYLFMEPTDSRIPEEDRWENSDDYRTALVKWDTVAQVGKLLAVDGGEPEDQLFCRDLSWVIDALEEAYTDGLKEGKNESAAV